MVVIMWIRLSASLFSAVIRCFHRRNDSQPQGNKTLVWGSHKIQQLYFRTFMSNLIIQQPLLIAVWNGRFSKVMVEGSTVRTCASPSALHSIILGHSSRHEIFTWLIELPQEWCFSRWNVRVEQNSTLDPRMVRISYRGVEGKALEKHYKFKIDFTEWSSVLNFFQPIEKFSKD